MKLHIALGVLIAAQGAMGMEEKKRKWGSKEVNELLDHLCGSDEELASEMPFKAQLQQKHRIPIDLKTKTIIADTNDVNAPSCFALNDMVARLLEVAGSNLEVHGKNYFINYPLHLAVEHGLLPDINTLLLAGADYRVPDDEGRTLLHIAFALDKSDERSSVIKKFLTVGTDLSIEDTYGNTLFCLAGNAVVKGDEQLMNYFLMEDSGKGTDDPFIAKTLMQNNRLVVDKHTECIVAGQGIESIRLQCFNYVVQQLFKFACKTLLPTQHEHYFPNPLHLAVKHALVPCVYLLLYEGVDPNAADHLGKAPLHVACLLEDFDIKRTIIQRLLVAKAMIDIATKNGDTALTMVARQGNDRLVKFLLKRKANPNIHVHAAKQQEFSAHACGDSPLYAAASRGHLSTVTLLLKEKAKLKQSEQQALRFKLAQPEHKKLKELLNLVIDKKIVRAYSK